jgi:succinylglutamic semialdehyde dehydrogenase
VWEGRPDLKHVDAAIAAARAALPPWRAMGLEGRSRVLRRFQAICKERENAIADLICDETGKVLWDAKAEAGLLPAKIDITLDASHNSGLARVTGFDVPLADTRTGRAWFRPHGVMGVLAPFNFPAHLPNGHIAPALLMGNTIVLKPSDKTPGVGQMLAELFDQALREENAPPGVLNLVQGAADVAKTIVNHAGIDGILFTGSWGVGRAITAANLDRPGRILALEMGGNNAAVVLPDCDLKQAVVECVRCAFITTGQRCTCTRRVIVHRAIAGKFIAALCKAASNLVVGDPRATHPVFMGPIIREDVLHNLHATQAQWMIGGGEILVESTRVESLGDGFYLTPGVVKVERCTDSNPGRGDGDAGCDLEVFGPMLRVSVVDSLDDAIVQTNATAFGLAASIFTKGEASIARFLDEARAGCINVNTGTAGASSKLPFGGLGRSGNHRPAGAYSLDYCAYPVAGMIERGAASTISPGMLVEDSWLA